MKPRRLTQCSTGTGAALKMELPATDDLAGASLAMQHALSIIRRGWVHSREETWLDLEVWRRQAALAPDFVPTDLVTP